MPRKPRSLSLPLTPTALTVAGSDPSGGAGIQADLKVFTRFGVYGMAVPAALTVQDTAGVQEVADVPARVLARQLEAVLRDIPPNAAKTGMLWSERTVETVAAAFRDARVPNLVVDPVILSSTGVPLLSERGVKRLVQRLLPLATVVTPNLHEAQRLSGLEVTGLERMKEAAAAILDTGPRYVLIKGGHLREEPIDVLFYDDAFEVFEGTRVTDRALHGTGCVLSAALTACLAQGDAVPVAVARAKAFVEAAIQAAAPVGKGRIPLNLTAADPADTPGTAARRPRRKR